MGRAIIVTGPARGGTSLVASMIANMGVPMGKGGPRYENPYLQWAVIADRWDVVRLLIDRIDAHRPLWGWKLPFLVRHLGQVAEIVPDATFLLVTKDIVSIARRKADPADGARFAKMIGRHSRSYALMARFGMRSEMRTRFVSYEETMRDLDGAMAELATLCGLEPPTATQVETVRGDGARYRAGNPPTRVPDAFDLELATICADHGVFQPGTAPPTG